MSWPDPGAHSVAPTTRNPAMKAQSELEARSVRRAAMSQGVLHSALVQILMELPARTVQDLPELLHSICDKVFLSKVAHLAMQLYRVAGDRARVLNQDGLAVEVQVFVK